MKLGKVRVLLMITALLLITLSGYSENFSSFHKKSFECLEILKDVITNNRILTNKERSKVNRYYDFNFTAAVEITLRKKIMDLQADYFLQFEKVQKSNLLLNEFLDRISTIEQELHNYR